MTRRRAASSARSFRRSTRKGKTRQGRRHRALRRADVVALCDEIMEIAFERGASDIHIDPGRKHHAGAAPRRRRAGAAAKAAQVDPQRRHQPLQSAVARWTSPSGAWPRTAGSFNAWGPSSGAIHIRAATLPTTHGERLTLRLLAVETEQLTLNRLGMSEVALRTFADVHRARSRA